mgnify:CR=1 FL=1
MITNRLHHMENIQPRTIRIDTALWRAFRVQAAREGKTLIALLSEILTSYLTAVK